MLVAVISGSEYLEALKKSVEVINGQLAFEQLVQGSEDLGKALAEIKRSYVDVLVIDLTCADPVQLYNEITSFRLIKEKTRIIVASPGASPGDVLLRQLVSIGIYDIVAAKEEEQIAQEVSHLLQSEPKSLAAAWRWFAGPDESEAVGGQGKTTTKTKTIIKTTDKVVEQVVYRDRIIGSVVIAVAGAMEGAGCTHFALSTAKYFAKANKTVALVELNDRPSLGTLREDVKAGPFYLHNFKVFPNIKEPHQLLEVFQEAYNYVVLDLGVVKRLSTQGTYVYSPWYQELIRADVTVVIAFGSLWQIPRLMILNSNQEPSANWVFLLNHCDQKSKDVIAVLKETGFSKVFHNVYNPDPFTFNQECETLFETVFANYVEQKKRKRLLSWQLKSV